MALLCAPLLKFSPEEDCPPDKFRRTGTSNVSEARDGLADEINRIRRSARRAEELSSDIGPSQFHRELVKHNAAIWGDGCGKVAPRLFDRDNPDAVGLWRLGWPARSADRHEFADAMARCHGACQRLLRLVIGVGVCRRPYTERRARPN